MPPTYGLGMHPAYSYGIQPPPHIQWNPSPVPLFLNLGKYILVFAIIYLIHPHDETDVAIAGGGEESTHVSLEQDSMYQATPPPVTQQTQTQEEQPLRGRGMRDHQAPNRLSPTGPRQRRSRRYRTHRDE